MFSSLRNAQFTFVEKPQFIIISFQIINIDIYALREKSNIVNLCMKGHLKLHLQPFIIITSN